MKFISTLSFLLLFTLSISAQSLLNHIPDDVMMVASIHPNELGKKMSMEQLKSMPMYEMLLQEMVKSLNPGKRDALYDVFKNPSSYGMDLNSPSYIFGNMSVEDEMSMSYIFQLSDASKFRSVLDEYTDESFKKAIQKKKDYHLVNNDNEMAMGWNNNMVVFTFASPKIDYDQTEEEIEAARQENKANLGKSVNNILHPNPAKSIASKAGYTALANGSKDMMMWLNYESLMSMYSDMGSMGMSELDGITGGPYASMAMGALSDLYKETYWGMKLNFNTGAVKLDSDMYMSEKFTRFFSGMTNNRVDKKFAKYIKGDNLLGYFAFSMDIPEMVKGYKEFGLDIVKDMPMIGDLSKDALDIIGIVVDEEALYDLFTGDMVIAVTGMREFEKMTKTFEYDDDFNQTEVEKMVKETLPEFTMMMSYGNKSDLMKLVRLGVHTSVIKSEGAYFSIDVPDMPMDIFMAMENDIMYLTNNRDLVQNRLSKGYPKKERLSKAHCKKMQAHPMVFHWDVPKSMQAAAAMNPMAAGMLNAERSPVTEVNFLWDPIEGRINHSVLQVDFADKNRNSLEVLAELMESLAPMMMGM